MKWTTDSYNWQTSLRDLLLVIFRRRWAVLTIILSGVLGVLFWMFFIHEDQYDTSAKILVKIGNEQTNTSNVGSNPPILITGQRMEDVNSEMDILQSTDLIQQFVDRFHLDQPSPPTPPPPQLIARIRYEVRGAIHALKLWKDAILVKLGMQERLSPRDAAIAEVRQRLTVDPERSSNVITVHLAVDVRQSAGMLLNGLLDLYQTFRLNVYRGHGAEQFFTGEVEQRSQDLHEAEQELRAFEDQSNISAIQKQKEVLLDQIAEAQNSLTAAEIAVSEADDRVQRASAEMKKAEPEVAALGSFPPNSFPNTLLAQLAALQKERESLRMTELDSGDRILNNRKQFQVLLGMLATQLNSDLAEKRSAYGKRVQALAELQNKLRRIQDKETEWSALKRKVTVSEDSYLSYHKKLEDATASAALEEQNIGSIAIIQHAIDPTTPLGMSKLRIFGLTLLLSLFVAAAWLSVAEFLDHRIYEPEDLEKHLQAPVLEVVPAPKQGLMRLLRPGSVSLAPLYRRAAWLLANDSSSSRRRTILFADPSTGAGTTTAVLAIAQHLASRYNLKTVVVQLTGQARKNGKGLLLDDAPNLEDCIAGKRRLEECIQQNDGTGVALIRSFSAAEHLAIDAAKLRQLLNEIESQFDVTLIAAPPLLSAECLPILSVVKDVVIVVEGGLSRSEVIDRVKEQLKAENVSVIGAILSNHERCIPAWIYRWLL